MLSVKQIQMNLKFLNYYYDKIDGIKGNNTINAIKNFQRDNGLAVDGIYGVQTEGALVPMIKQIQVRVGTEADGVAGENTMQKTREYQNANGLQVDGIAGEQTRNHMFPQTKLTWDDIKYFKKSEFACKDGCGFDNINLKLVKILDQMREHYGRPIIITSGCRCRKHNLEVGGVQGSRHELGKAADLYVQGVNVNDFLAYAKDLVNKGVLRYTYTNNSNMHGVIHMDIQ